MNFSRDYILLVTSFLNRVRAGHSGVENSFQEAMAAWFRVLLVPQKMPTNKALRVTDVFHGVHQRAFTLVTSEAANFQTFQLINEKLV